MASIAVDQVMVKRLPKQEGQVFTPPGIVCMILDAVGYKGRHILEKKVMEPSFGNGAFLLEMANRIINEGEKAGFSTLEIKPALESCMFGFEKDEGLYYEAIQTLNRLLESRNIPAATWPHLYRNDTLLGYPDFVGVMDFCVGNPPYVRIHNIATEYRDVVKRFRFADGTTDLYIAFFDVGLQMLRKDSGVLGYITPNSFLKNSSQRSFRKYLNDSRCVSAIYDFKDSKIFDVNTYPCISVLDMALTKEQNESFEYREYSMYELVKIDRLEYKQVCYAGNGAAWLLGSREDVSFLNNVRARTVKLSDIADVQNGVTTNRNRAYIGQAFLDKNEKQPYFALNCKKNDNEIVWFNHKPVEAGILRRCVKGSTYNGMMGNTYILFPYHKSESKNSVVPYTEEELHSLFPLAYRYLEMHKEELLTRNMDPELSWFLYARSQGLVNSGKKKIVLKHVMPKSAKAATVNIVDEDVIVYSGLFVTMKGERSVDRIADNEVNNNSGCYNIDEIKQILSASDFCKYCVLAGRNMQGGYISISSPVLKAYGFALD